MAFVNVSKSVEPIHYEKLRLELLDALYLVVRQLVNVTSEEKFRDVVDRLDDLAPLVRLQLNGAEIGHTTERARELLDRVRARLIDIGEDFARSPL